MYERFTDRARKVMRLATQEACRCHHQYIATEHLLLGLITKGSGVAAHALQNLDIDLHRVRAEVEKMIVAGPVVARSGKLPQTPRLKKTIEYTLDEARHLNHNYIGTEHLLLGLLREQEGVAAQVLFNLGAKLEDVRGEVQRLLGVKTISSPRSGRSPAGFELVARRAGLWTRKHQISCIFGGGLLTTLVGAVAGVNFVGLGRANIGALVAGGTYVIAVAIACLASRARKGFGRKLS